MVHHLMRSLTFKKIKTMENTLPFVLGVLTTLGIFGLGFLFITTLKIKKEIFNLRNELQDIRLDLEITSRQYNDIYCNSEDESNERFKHLEKQLSNLDDKIHLRLNSLNSYVDSRFDKQIDRISHIIDTHNSIIHDELNNIRSSEKEIQQINS